MTTLVLDRRRAAVPAAQIRAANTSMPAIGVPTAHTRLISHNVHPAAIGIALGGYGVVLAAAWIGFGYGYQRFLFGVILLLSVMYFVPLIGMGADAERRRTQSAPRGFRDFLRGQVATATGATDGLDALVQIAFAPVLYGLAMACFAAIWLHIAHHAAG